MLRKQNTENLVLAITSRCNLRCMHCQVQKENKDMESQTAWRAVSLFLDRKKLNDSRLIRFFGGEPLLNFNLIREIITLTDRKYKNLNFDLTTNGLLLNNDVLNFLRDKKNTELIISPHKPQIFIRQLLIKDLLKLSKVTINLNFAPGKVRVGVENFKKFITMGFFRFNFLPVYFVFWPKSEIKLLRAALEEVKKIINALSGKIYIKNLSVCSPVPLFNSILTVDPTGSIYAGNLFLDKRFSRWKNELKLGSVYDIRKWQDVSDLPFDYNFDFLIRKTLPEDIVELSFEVDQELSRFCESFKKGI